MKPERVFDQPHYCSLDQARIILLRDLVGEWKTQLALETAWDVGCGVGHFSALLQELGLQTRALDGRAENTQEATRRVPALDVRVADVEDPALPELGGADLVFCLGLLYHLENPFRAIRNLALMTHKMIIIESICTWDELPVMYLREEGPTEDQGLRHIAFYPSEECLIKMLYRSGFSHVYRFTRLPDNIDFRTTANKKKRRTMLVASRMEVSSPYLALAKEHSTSYDPWVTAWARSTQQVKRVRGFMAKPWPGKISAIRRLFGIWKSL